MAYNIVFTVRAPENIGYGRHDGRSGAILVEFLLVIVPFFSNRKGFDFFFKFVSKL